MIPQTGGFASPPFSGCALYVRADFIVRFALSQLSSNGYVPGGPVANAAAAGVPPTISPPTNQPPQKSYLDWNGDSHDPEKSWIINEPSIYYQSAYVELVSAFAQ
jgi:hypothetical protein